MPLLQPCSPRANNGYATVTTLQSTPLLQPYRVRRCYNPTGYATVTTLQGTPLLPPYSPRANNGYATVTTIQGTPLLPPYSCTAHTGHATVTAVQPQSSHWIRHCYSPRVTLGTPMLQPQSPHWVHHCYSPGAPERTLGWWNHSWLTIVAAATLTCTNCHSFWFKQRQQSHYKTTRNIQSLYTSTTMEW